MVGLAPELTDGGWLHSDGSFAGIRGVIVTGVPLDDAMVDVLAASIWALSHTGA